MNYTHIAPLRDTHTPAQIAEGLSARLVRAIPLVDLERWLDFRGFAYRLDGKWAGVLPKVRDDERVPEQLRDGISALLRHLEKTQSTELAMDDPSYAIQAHALMAGLVQLGQFTKEDHGEFDAAGGGHLYPDGVTKQEVIDAIAEHDAQAAALESQKEQSRFRAEVMNDHVNGPLANGTASELVAGLRAAADQIEGK